MIGLSTWVTLVLVAPPAGPGSLGAAQPSDPPPAKAEPLACIADAAKLCKGIPAGGGRHLECLASQPSKLSVACRKQMDPIADEVLAWRDACGADIDTHCSDKWVGLGLGACLAQHKKQLAPQCRVKVTGTQAYLALACGAQVADLCGDVEPGDGKVLACLDDHDKDIEAPCKGLWFGYEAAFKLTCAKDIATHCGGDMAFDAAIPCLQAHQRSLTPACHDLVEPGPVAPPKASLGAGKYAGVYATDWGGAVCTQASDDAKVKCKYNGTIGSITCTPQSATDLQCRWKEGAAKGRAKFKTGEKNNWLGTWGHGGKFVGGGAWLFVKLK